MMGGNRAIAYKEVYRIIEFLDEKNKNKIPQAYLEYIYEVMDKNYDIVINPNMNLKSQNLQKETFTILAMIYTKYLCDEKRKIELVRKFKENQKKSDEKLKELYDVDKIFKKEIENTRFNNELNLPTIQKSENIIVKVKKFILKCLNKK